MLIWIFFGANTPDESRRITVQELAYIQETSEKSSDEKIKSIKEWPIKSILTSQSVLIIIATNVLSDFTLYGIFSVLPDYLWEMFNIGVKNVSFNACRFNS